MRTALDAIILSAAVFLLPAMICGTCLAFNPLVADDYDTIDPGKTQIEVYYSSIKNADSSQVGSLGFQIKKGVDSDFNIGLNLPVILPQFSGPDRSFFNMKWGLPGYASREGFSARINAGIENNPVSKRIVKGALNFSGSVMYSKKLGKVDTHYRLGLAKSGGWHADNILDWYTTSSITAVIPAERIGTDLICEYNLETSGTPNPQMIQLGAKKELFDWLALDLGYGMGLNDNSPVRLATLGLAYLF